MTLDCPEKGEILNHTRCNVSMLMPGNGSYHVQVEFDKDWQPKLDLKITSQFALFDIFFHHPGTYELKATELSTKTSSDLRIVIEDIDSK